MNTEALKIGDIIEIVVFPAKIMNVKIHSEKVTVHSIYNEFVVVDNGRYKFCIMNHDYKNQNKIAV